MSIDKQFSKFIKLSLLLCIFFILTGFEFMGMQEKLQNAEDLLSKNEYVKAEGILNSVINSLKVIDESSSEMEKTAKSLLTPQVYFMLGEIQYKQNKYEDAVKYFNEIINFEIRSMWDIKAFYYLGMSEFNLKKYNEARGQFSGLVNDYSDSKEAAEGQYYIGLSYELENNKEQADAAFRKFLALYPGHPWAVKAKGKIE